MHACRLPRGLRGGVGGAALALRYLPLAARAEERDRGARDRHRGQGGALTTPCTTLRLPGDCWGAVRGYPLIHVYGKGQGTRLKPTSGVVAT